MLSTPEVVLCTVLAELIQAVDDDARVSIQWQSAVTTAVTQGGRSL